MPRRNQLSLTPNYLTFVWSNGEIIDDVVFEGSLHEIKKSNFFRLSSGDWVVIENVRSIDFKDKCLALDVATVEGDRLDDLEAYLCHFDERSYS